MTHVQAALPAFNAPLFTLLFERGGRGLINFETAFERGEMRPSLSGLRRGWFYCELPRAAQVRGSRWMGAPEDVAVEKALSDRYVSMMEPSRGPGRPTAQYQQAPEGAGGGGDTSGQNCEP